MSTKRVLGANYLVGECLGAGASGLVYEGIHKVSGERVAIKFLREQYREDSQMLARFFSERTLLTTITHRSIVRVRDLVAEDGELAIIMDYLPGPTLANYLSERGTLAPHLALTITAQILTALDYAHSNQLIHRDIKPDNIIITCPDDVKNPGVVITDFGIASILGTSNSLMTTAVGTAAYMAPELIKDSIISPSVDLYAVGITCYQMLTSTTPFDTQDDANAFTIANRHLTMAPPSINGLGSKTLEFLKALLAKNPEQRASVSQIEPLLQAALKETIDQDPLPALKLNPNHYHQATIIKTQTESKAVKATKSRISTYPIIGTLPDLPVAKTATIIKPQLDQPASVASAPEEKPQHQVPWRKRIPLIATLAGLIIAVVTIFAWWVWSQTAPSIKQIPADIQASVDEPTLASGLKITRSAKWSSQNHTITYTIAYSSIKTPVQGQVMEILTNMDGSCLTPKWQSSKSGIATTAHSPAKTSIKANCAWTITLPKTTKNPNTITAILTPKTTLNNDQDLHAWLLKQTQTTTKALNDPHTTSTAYPLQRLSNIRLKAPRRIPQGKIIPITIIGIWPSGENPLTPIYTSPSTSEPTSIIKDLTTANPSLVRLNDRCSGAVSITPSGHEITTLYPSTNCTISAQIGNYETNQTPITITTTGS